MLKKIKYVFLLGIFLVLCISTESKARITTSDPTVESGGTVTITINSQENVASGAIYVTSNGGLTFVSASGISNGTEVAFAGTENKKNAIATYKFKAPNVSKTTTYKVSFASKDMADANGNPVSSSNATSTVTVKAKSSGNNSGSSSSGTGSSGSNNQPSTKPTFTSVNETVYAESSVNVRSSYSTSSSIVGSLEAGDSVTRTGKGSNGWSKVQYNGQTAYINSSYLTTEKPEESNEKDLKSLTVDTYKLSPEFSKDVTEYSLTVGGDVDSVKVNAEASDSKAKVEITGNDNLLMGENTIEIKVTAEDGTVKTYKINVTKGEAAKIGLEELTIEGYTLNPVFSSDVYEYTLEINDTSVTSLPINAKASTEGANVEIIGNEQLIIGENIITILVRSNEETATYQIKVNITEKTEEQIIAGIDNKDLYLYIGIGIAVIILIIIIIVVKNRHKNSDVDTYYAGFEPLGKKRENNAKIERDTNNDTNYNLENQNSKLEENKDYIFEDRKNIDKKSIIEQNFGADIQQDKYDLNSDSNTKKKRGKHF